MADASEPPSENVLVLGALEIDLAGHLATFQGRTLQLSSSQFELLAILVANHRRVVSRCELSERLGLERGRSVDVMLSMLRRQLGCDFVRNVRKRGWIIIPTDDEQVRRLYLGRNFELKRKDYLHDQAAQ